jgi:SAM-dependent methyltransferase
MGDIPTENFTVVQCDNCTLLYLNPRPTTAEIGRYYPPTYYPATAPVSKHLTGGLKRWIRQDFYNYPRLKTEWWQPLRKVLLWPEKAWRVFRGRNILPWIGEGRLLDVGCSSGGNLASFQDQGWDVYGIDVSHTAVKIAQKRFGDRVRHGSLIDAAYPHSYFNVVHFSHSLEHMHNPLNILMESHRILSDNNLLVVTVPNAGSLERKLLGHWWVQWDLPRHLYHFDMITLHKLLHKAGFQVIHHRTGVGTTFLVASLQRLLEHFYGKPVPRWAERVFDKLVAKPICLVAGHLGYGTEMTVYASKT